MVSTGKILAFINALGGAASGGGSASAGSGLFIVKCDLMGKVPTEDPGTPGQYIFEGVTFDKTYDEIVAYKIKKFTKIFCLSTFASCFLYADVLSNIRLAVKIAVLL